MLRRLAVASNLRCSHVRYMSLRSTVKKHGIPVALYYWVVNEIVVCFLTYLLHYGYFGQEDLVSFLEQLGASNYVNLTAVEKKSWPVFDGRVVISARLIANFTAASVFMSLWTPLKLPLAIATYPAFRRLMERFNIFRISARKAP